MKIKLLVIFSVSIFCTDAFTEETLWNEFKTKHNKSYIDLNEEQHRYATFLETLQKIKDHNEKYERGEVTWYQKVTKFADWTKNEYEAWLNRNVASRPTLDGAHKFQGRIVETPESFDWRDHRGAVLEIKDQGDCGACWAFSATGSLEAQNFLKNNVSIKLSDQQLVDCSTLLGNQGCGGGNMPDAFKYGIKYGIETEEYYPYIGKNGECLYDPTKTVVQPAFVMEVEQSEVTLVSALVEVGPISAAINANPLSYYGGGIFDVPKCPSEFADLNHGVLVVGYGVEDGVPYWIVKNSWGADWGEDGYFRIVRHLDNSSKGMCGIVQYLSYAVLK